jgi:MarR family transcriptional regulator, organic hydroperoxide resistance regulator
VLHEAPLRADRSLEEEFPQVDSLASDCIINLWRTYAMVAEQLGTLLRPHDLTLTGFRVVMMLRVNGMLMPAQIADRLGSARATVTGVVDSLEKRGLVRRSQHPDDRRRLHVAITDEGRALLETILPGWFTEERDVMAGLDRDEQAQLVELLGALQRELHARRAPGAVGRA